VAPAATGSAGPKAAALSTPAAPPSTPAPPSGGSTPSSGARSPWLQLAHGASVVLSGISAGGEITLAFGYVPIAHERNARDYILGHQQTTSRLGITALPFLGTVLFPPAVLALTRDPRRPSFILAALGLACSLASVITTLSVTVPLNDRIAKMSPDAPPPNWMDLRNQWETAHYARTSLFTAAFLFNAASALTP
jgi:hypothetical protein